MKKIIFSIILLMISFSVNAQTELQLLKVGNVTISYNQEAAETIGFTLDVTITDNSGSGLCKDANVAIPYIQKLCGCKLTPNQVLYLFRLANQDAPDWAKKAAKVVPL